LTVLRQWRNVKTIVVVPTYNERDNVVPLITAVMSQGEGLEVLVVDDSSPDGTADVVADIAAQNPRVHLLVRPCKSGLGSAYREGFHLALQWGADVVMQMDADFSHDPSMIPAFLAALETCDVVVGSRYLNGVSVVNWPIRRLMLSYGANVYTRLVTGLRLTDCTGGFKCFRAAVLRSIDLNSIRSDGYSFQIEVNYRCVEGGFRVGELPIIFIDRHAGTSKMSKRIVREAVVMVWRLRVGSLLRSCLPGGGHA
jgi:dolichol-phosphate mannosyltransferase